MKFYFVILFLLLINIESVFSFQNLNEFYQSEKQGRLKYFKEIEDSFLQNKELDNREEVLIDLIKEKEFYIDKYTNDVNNARLQFEIARHYRNTKLSRYKNCNGIISAVNLIKTIIFYPAGPQVQDAMNLVKTYKKSELKEFYDFFMNYLNKKANTLKSYNNKEVEYLNFLFNCFSQKNSKQKKIYDFAIDEYKKYLKIMSYSEGKEFFHFNIYNFYLRKKVPELAVIELLKFANLFSTSKYYKDIYFKIGIIAENDIKDYKLAVYFYEKELEYFKNSNKVPDTLLAIGNIYEKKLKNKIVAIEYYDKIIKMYPDFLKNIEIYLKIGNIYNKMKNYFKAAMILKQGAVKYFSNPRSLDLYLLSAEAYEKAKDYETASQIYLEIVKKYNNVPYIEKYLFYVGTKIYKKTLKSPVKSKQILQSLIEKYPNSKYSMKARKMIYK